MNYKKLLFSALLVVLTVAGALYLSNIHDPLNDGFKPYIIGLVVSIIVLGIIRLIDKDISKTLTDYFLLIFAVGAITFACKPLAYQFLINPQIQKSEMEKLQAEMNENGVDFKANQEKLKIGADGDKSDVGEGESGEVIGEAGGSDNSNSISQNGQDEYSHPNDPNITYDPRNIESISEISPSNAKINLDYAVGLIYLPDVGIKLPILEGLTNENLNVASGTMKPNQVMGKGNYAIAGHYSWYDSLLFTSLKYSKPGQPIYLYDGETVYEYEITDIFITPPTAGHVIHDSEGDGLVTLVSCTTTDGTERRIVRGKLKSKKNIQNVNKNLKQALTTW